MVISMKDNAVNKRYQAVKRDLNVLNALIINTILAVDNNQNNKVPANMASERGLTSLSWYSK